MRIAMIAKPGYSDTGVGRYVRMLHDGLRAIDVDVVRTEPVVPPLPNAGYSTLRQLGIDVRSFLRNYPIWVTYPSADVYHLTSQNLASLLLLRPPRGNVVVTVHDIIPYMLRANPQLRSYRTVADRLFDLMAMAGLRRADRLVTVSAYTKRCVVELLAIEPDKIDVVHHGIDDERFRPLAVPATIRDRYGLPNDRRYLIYVGSEDPRKNLVTLVRALAAIRCELPDVELIKIGRAHFDGKRRNLTGLADQLGVRSAIHFLDDVPEHDLPLLYNVADVCVLPSLYEGFCFPALEAMACGTPIVCSRTAALPEIVGDAGILVDCADGNAGHLADAIKRVLVQQRLAEALRASGIARTARFRWPDAVRQMTDVYAGYGVGTVRCQEVGPQVGDTGRTTSPIGNTRSSL